MSDVVYLYGHGRRKHIKVVGEGGPHPKALCGWRFYTEFHFLRYVSRSRMNVVAETAHLRALPVCAHCDRVNGWLQ